MLMMYLLQSIGCGHLKEVFARNDITVHKVFHSLPILCVCDRNDYGHYHLELTGES